MKWVLALVIAVALLGSLVEARRSHLHERVNRKIERLQHSSHGVTLLSELSSQLQAEQVKSPQTQSPQAQQATPAQKQQTQKAKKAPVPREEVETKNLRYVLSRLEFNVKQEDIASAAEYNENRLMKRLLYANAKKRLATTMARVDLAKGRVANSTIKIEKHSSVIPILEAYIPLRNQEIAELDRQIGNITWTYNEEVRAGDVRKNNTRLVISLLKKIVLQLNRTSSRKTSAQAQARFREQLQELRVASADPYISSLIESTVTAFLSNTTQQTLKQLRSLVNLLLTEIESHNFHLERDERVKRVQDQEILLEMKRRRSIMVGDIALKERHLTNRRKALERHLLIVSRETEIIVFQEPLIAVYSSQILTLKNSLRYMRDQYLAEVRQRKEVLNTVKAIRMVLRVRDPLTFKIVSRLTKIEIPPLILRAGVRCCRLCGKGLIACGNKCIPLGQKCRTTIISGCACNITPAEIQILQHSERS